MYEECPAKLKMERVILKDGFFDETIHICKVINCDPEKEISGFSPARRSCRYFPGCALHLQPGAGGRERKLPGTDPGTVLEQAGPCDRISYSEWIL